MPPPVPDGDLLLDESYDSAEDEDFELDDAEPDAQEDSDLSAPSDADADDEVTEPAKKRRKTTAQPEEVSVSEEKALDSGDEATIRKAKERKRKRDGKEAGMDDDEEEEEEDEMDFGEDEEEEGGQAGFVKTRAMRMRMQAERKPLAKIEGATIDVDALWEKMNAPDTDSRLLPSQSEKKQEEKAPVTEKGSKGAAPQDTETQPTQDKDSGQQTRYPEEMIKIKRTYKFAGEVITEEKVVLKDSAEAKLFLAHGGDVEAITDADVENAANAKSALKLRRPLRKISRFDPNPTGSIKRSWEKQPVAEAGVGAENAKGPKINTVEKSRLDWAAYVDQAGIKDELRVHSKAKEGYLGRMDFLGRVEAKREEERRSARLRGV